MDATFLSPRKLALELDIDMASLAGLKGLTVRRIPGGGLVYLRTDIELWAATLPAEPRPSAEDFDPGRERFVRVT